MPIFDKLPKEMEQQLPEGFRLSGPQGSWKEYVVYRNDMLVGHIVRMGRGWQCNSSVVKPWKNPVGWKKSITEAVLLLGEHLDNSIVLH